MVPFDFLLEKVDLLHFFSFFGNYVIGIKYLVTLLITNCHLGKSDIDLSHEVKISLIIVVPKLVSLIYKWRRLKW